MSVSQLINDERGPSDYSQLFHLTKCQLGMNFSTANLLDDELSPQDKHLIQEICEIALAHALGNGNEYVDYLQSFTRMCKEFLKEQMYLERTGQYRYQSAVEAFEKTLSSPDEAKQYLQALLMSQAFWRNHRQIIYFFRDQFLAGAPENGRVLEVPSGTGFFLSDFMRKMKHWEGLSLDLSSVAIEFAGMTHALLNAPDATFQNKNLFDLSEGEPFDRIICGELIEHVNHPDEVLRILKQHLTTNGQVFITTAIWAASTDHVYLFRNAEDVRKLLREEFQIVDELVLPIDRSVSIDSEKNAMNYAAILMR
ncbi:class I SAM-dependent methyltransferase [Algicola sagamiensis]|uniref:class I SAM-dependent methyltransferase n=1 Tax=Algicola sagamiensis TaxID=163869 RepID=UPI0003708BEA|nr:methyltransferase domain-containing protein [Algicola sagamiensis]